MQATTWMTGIWLILLGLILMLPFMLQQSVFSNICEQECARSAGGTWITLGSCQTPAGPDLPGAAAIKTIKQTRHHVTGAAKVLLTFINPNVVIAFVSVTAFSVAAWRFLHVIAFSPLRMCWARRWCNCEAQRSPRWHLYELQCWQCRPPPHASLPFGRSPRAFDRSVWSVLQHRRLSSTSDLPLVFLPPSVTWLFLLYLVSWANSYYSSSKIILPLSLFIPHIDPHYVPQSGTQCSWGPHKNNNNGKHNCHKWKAKGKPIKRVPKQQCVVLCQVPLFKDLVSFYLYPDVWCMLKTVTN